VGGAVVREKDTGRGRRLLDTALFDEQAAFDGRNRLALLLHLLAELCERALGLSRV